MRGDNRAVRLLLVETNPRQPACWQKDCASALYAVDIAADGRSATARVSVSDYDAVILDLGLPDTDGLMLCRDLRANSLTAPILILTARDAIQMRIAGLDSGADDYMTKPFDFDELLARLRALYAGERARRFQNGFRSVH